MKVKRNHLQKILLGIFYVSLVLIMDFFSKIEIHLKKMGKLKIWHGLCKSKRPHLVNC